MSDAKFTTQVGLTLDKDEFKDAYVGGRFVIDCAEIRLTQNGSETPRVYSSLGYIQVSPEHGVEARLVCPRDPSDVFDPMAAFMRGNNFTSGVMMPDSHYYRLKARDVAGNVWTCPAVYLKREERPDAVILTLRCDRIKTEEPSEGARPYAYLVFLNTLDFPTNMGQTTTVERGGKLHSRDFSRQNSQGVVAGFQVSYDERKSMPGERYSEFIARAPEGVPAPPLFQDRLLEAIRFCTATMATPIMSETVADNVKVIELARSRPLNNGLVHAPVPSSEHGIDGDFYKLFECYFNYACANADGKDFAPLSSKLGGLFTLKGVWLDTIVLLLGVAVEGVLSEEVFKSIGKPKKRLLEDIKKLVDLVKLAPVEESLITRVVNAVGNMKSNNAADKLHALIEVGALEEEDRKAWKRLRNASTHGNFKIDPEEMQRLLDDVFRLTTIIYKLVFVRIGYCGKYSNRAGRGWRVDRFDAATYLEALEANAKA